MARGEDDPGAAVQGAHRVGKHGRGDELRVKVDLYAVRRKHARRRARKHIGLDARIVGDGDGGFFEIRVEIVRKPLRRLVDGVDVHAVRARADHAAQPRRAEFQIFVETVEDLLIVSFNCFQLRQQVLVRCCLFTPKVVKRMDIVHGKAS